MARVFTDPGPLEFEAEIVRNAAVANASAFIEFPHDLKETFGVGSLVPVVATYDGRVTYRGSLAKMGGPSPVLVLRKDVRAELGKEPGDRVGVSLGLDDSPREVAVADDLGRPGSRLPAPDRSAVRSAATVRRKRG
jgi:hypothetical protein